MEGLIILAVLYAWFSVIRKAVQGQKARNQSGTRRAAPAGAKPGQAQARQAQKPSQGPASGKTNTPRAAKPASHRAASGEGMSRGYQPMQTHMSELLHEEEELNRATARQAYAGSLGGESQEGSASREGEDGCDPSLGHGKPAPLADADSVYQNAIGGEPALAWNSQSLLQGIVMSEILKRPGERKWGRV